MNWKRCLSMLCAAALAAVLVSGISAMEPASPIQYDGLDISQYQGDMDFTLVKEAGYTVVYIRAGEGDSFIDPCFTRNAHSAKQAGIEFWFYYFVTASTTVQARQQAYHFAHLIQGTGYTTRPAMDFEVFRGITTDQVRLVAHSFLETLHQLTGITPLPYTDAYNAKAVWDSSFSSYPLWIAEYNGNLPPEDDTVWNCWTAYQYSDQGRIPGIDGDVDLDRMSNGVFLLDFEQERQAESPRIARYVVRYGDTLWAIARHYGVTVEQLAAENHILNPNLIYVGQVLYIPQETNNSRAKTYAVKPGDTPGLFPDAIIQLLRIWYLRII